MKVINWMKATYSEDEWECRPLVRCYDGFRISIQGGTSHHYCLPRKLCNEYQEIELGFPTELDNLIAEYAEEPDTLSTVFGHGPIAIVELLIEKHGGIDYEKSIQEVE